MRLTEAQKKALKGAAKVPLDPKVIAARLFQLRWDSREAGGRFVHDPFDADPVSVSADGTYFYAEPQGRQRLDHFGNEGEGWDTEGWNYEYAVPLLKAVQRAVDKEFGAGVFMVEVGEKGHVIFHPQKPVY
jgi:hypothetical protein